MNSEDTGLLNLVYISIDVDRNKYKINSLIKFN